MNQVFPHKMDERLSATISAFCKKKPILEHWYDFYHILIILIVLCSSQHLKWADFKIYMSIFIFSWKGEAASRQTSYQLACSSLSSVYRHS